MFYEDNDYRFLLLLFCFVLNGFFWGESVVPCHKMSNIEDALVQGQSTEERLDELRTLNFISSVFF